MVDVLLGVVGILLAGTLYLIYRIFVLTGRYKGRRKPPLKALSGNDTSARLLLGFAIVFILGFWWYFFDVRDQFLPVASVQGEEIDGLFHTVLGVILVPFTLFNFLLFYAAYKYRRRKNVPAVFYPKNIPVEIGWTLVTAVVLVGLIVWGLGIWDSIRSPSPKNAEVVNIMGYQFAWGLRYPGPDNQLGSRDFRLTTTTNDFGMNMKDPSAYDDFMPMQLHLPVGKPVLLNIMARDVIHSIYLPHFRVKMDAVPGMPTKFWFTPKYTTAEMRIRTGDPNFNYELACAELCGRNHYVMKMIVIVEEPEEYEEWKREQKSWLSQHPEYLAEVPEDLRELARIKSGIAENDFIATEISKNH